MPAYVHHKFLFEVFEDIAKSKNQKEAAEKLLSYNKSLGNRDSLAMRDVLKGALDPKIVWRLPKDDPPYTPSEGHNAVSNVFKETQKFKYLVDGTSYSIDQQSKRENIYIGILESIHPKDAAVIVNMVRGEINYKHLTQTVVRMAFGDNFFEEDRIKNREKTKAA